MARKRITEIFHFLLPIRVWQRNLFDEISMILDKNKYSKKFGGKLPYEIATTRTLMINENSGMDIIYQKNKVHNLKIASNTINKILIYPGEVFSLCRLLRKSRKYGKYKDGLVLVGDNIIPSKGGGLCHLSNLLHYLFLMSPLTVIERHGHRIKSMPNPDKDSIDGIDATINSGWLDLKVKNNTKNTYQIIIDFDDKYMYGKILSNAKPEVSYKIINSNLKYIKKNKKTYESVSVVRIERNKKTNEITSSEKLYDEVVEITYNLPNETKYEEVKTENE